MSDVTQYDLYDETYLEGVSVDFRQSGNFVFRDAIPVTLTNKASGKIPHWPKSNSFANQDRPRERAELSKAPLIGISKESIDYNTQPREVAIPIPDEQRQGQDPEISIEEQKMATLVSIDEMDKEERLGRELLVDNIWWNGGSSATTASAMNLTVNTTDVPLLIEQAKEGILDVTGQRARHAIMSEKVFNRIRRHESLTSLFSGGATTDRPAQASAALVADLLELDAIYVSSAINSLGRIISNKVLVYYKNDTGVGPVAARKMVYSGLGVSGVGAEIDFYRDDEVRADIMRLTSEDTNVITSPGSGWLFDVTIS